MLPEGFPAVWIKKYVTPVGLNYRFIYTQFSTHVTVSKNPTC